MTEWEDNQVVVEWEDKKEDISSVPREQLFNSVYFNGGARWGGYAREGYRDFPVHEVTARHILARKPKSVLEIGAARGYILKRIQDAGISGEGLEISKHCYLTRACDGIHTWDLCNTPWPISTVFDLSYSVATLEHIPEEFLPAVIKEMSMYSRRGLHGVDFGHADDGWDKTHCSLFPKEVWVQKFAEHAPGWPVEIVDKEELERGTLPPEVLTGDGKVKLNIGSFTTMHHHGWRNLDIHDLTQFAQQNGYQFQRCDVIQGIPLNTESVDLIIANHFLEHLDYKQGLEFLRECRRVIKPDGCVRLVVPDARSLLDFERAGYEERTHEEPSCYLSRFDEINEGCASSSTGVGKLWSLLFAGHAAAYDEETLTMALDHAGFVPRRADFRQTAFPDNPGFRQILRETLDQLPSLSLYIDAVPELG